MMHVDDLVYDVLLLIADELGNAQDRNAFAQTNRRLYRILNPYLYHKYSHRLSLMPLEWAITKNSPGTASHFINANPNFFIDFDVFTGPVFRAVTNQHADIVALLLQRCRIDLNLTGYGYSTPFHAAAKLGNATIMQLLLEWTDLDADTTNDIGRRPLHEAARYGHTAIVKMLLESGRVDTSSGGSFDRNIVNYAAMHAHHDLLEYLISLVTPPHNSDFDCLSFLSTSSFSSLPSLPSSPSSPTSPTSLTSPSSPTSGAWPTSPSKLTQADFEQCSTSHLTPLGMAALHGHEKIVQMLLDSGQVDPTAPNRDNETAFFLAVIHDHTSTAELLFEASGQVLNQKSNHGRTAFAEAVFRGHTATVKMLLTKCQVHVNCRDQKGRTPLMTAAKSPLGSLVAVLLACERVNPNLADISGQTPLSAAIQRHNSKAVEALLASDRIRWNEPNTSSGITPFEQALRSSRPGGLVRPFLKLPELDSTWRSRHGETCLTLAIKSGFNKDLIDQLLKSGKADAYLFGPDQLMPVDMALQRGRTDVVEMLKEAMYVEDEVWVIA